MKLKGLLLALSVIIVLIIASIGVSFAYSASVESENDLGGDYCSISASINGSPITSVIVKSGSPSYLEFSSDGTEFQETLSLKYFHTKGTGIVLTIDFTCTTASKTSVINCLDSSGVTIGSTLLMGSGTKTGTITGIILPVGDNGIGTAEFRFQVEDISPETSVQMSFSVHPLEMSS